MTRTKKFFVAVVITNVAILSFLLSVNSFLYPARHVKLSSTSGVHPNDPEFYRQWHLSNDYYSGIHSAKVSEAWSVTKGSSSMRIGIIDTGVDVDHPDLVSKLIPSLGYDFGNGDSNPDDIAPAEMGGGHGTSVAGIAAATTDNGTGVAGVCWNCSLVPIKAWDDIGPYGIFNIDITRPLNLVQSIGYANDMGCQIINMSWGHSNWPEIPGIPSLTDACYGAYQDDRLLIAAAGNDATTEPHYPAALHSVMSVGASESDGERTSFSNYGAFLDILAPGRGLYTTKRDGVYRSFDGTSAAAPVVSGIAGLIWSMKPYTLTNDDVWQLLLRTAEDRGPQQGWDPETGWGIVDADSAARALANGRMKVEVFSGGFAQSLLQDSHTHVFYNNGGFPTGTYFGVKTYKYTKHINFPYAGYMSKPIVWVRSRQTKGWSAANPQFEYGYGNVVSSSMTPTGCDVETFAYHIGYNVLGQTINDWYPCDNPPCDDGPDLRMEVVQLGILKLIPPPPPTTTLTDNPAGIRIEWVDNNVMEEKYYLNVKESSQPDYNWTIQMDSNSTYYNHVTALGSESYDYCIQPWRFDQQFDVESQPVTIRNKANAPQNVVARTYYLAGGGVSQRIRVTWSPPINQKPGTIGRYKIKVYYPSFQSTQWIDNIAETNLIFCSEHLNNPLTITVYVVDTDNILGRASQTVSVTAGNIDIGCYSSPTLPPIPKLLADDGILPEEFALDQNYPNPFNNETSLQFTIGTSQEIELTVFNVLGERVKTLASGSMSLGRYMVSWDGTDASGRSVPSGIYLARLSSSSGASPTTRKMVLLK